MRAQMLAGTVGIAALTLALASSASFAPAAQAETVQSNGIRIAFGGGLTPHSLPRSAPGPARLSLDARVAGADGAPLPRLRSLSFALSPAVRIDGGGLPRCRLGQIQPSTTEEALAVCGAARVGGGSFAARVQLREQAPYPSRGRIVAFNGSYRGRPAILLHVFGREPVPTSYTLPLVIGREPGAFPTVLSTSLATRTPSAGRVTRLALTLGRSFEEGGRQHSYLAASCPAPPAATSTRLPLLRTELGFAGRRLAFTVSRGCGVR